jgi:hypothetical protein
MEDKNKEVKNWLDDRKEVLPDGFWESVEPHIPTYKKKRRMPFLFWLGLATVAAGLSYYLFDSKAEIKDEVHLNDTQNKTDDANKIKQDDMVSLRSMSSNLAQENNEEIISKVGKNPADEASNKKSLTTKNTVNKTSNVQKENLTNEIMIINENKSIDQEKNIYIIDKQDIKEEIEKSTQTTAHSQYDETFNKNLDIQLLPLIDVGIFKAKDIILTHKAINLVKPAEDQTHYIAQVGYNMVFLQRKMTSSDVENILFDNRKKLENNFISHELYANLLYKIHSRWSVGGGLRFTRVQELFDYDYLFIEANALNITTKKRIIEHTNTFDLIDIFGQVDYRFNISKLHCTISNTLAYNTILRVDGLFLNETNELGKLQDIHDYKSNIGWSHQLSLGLIVPVNHHFHLGFQGGYRHYLQNWSKSGADIQIGYKGFTVGTSVGYRF